MKVGGGLRRSRKPFLWLVASAVLLAGCAGVETKHGGGGDQQVEGGSVSFALWKVVDGLVVYVSFLGLGVPPPNTNWGAMLSKGITHTYDGAWWLIPPPGIAIVLVICAVNSVGDGLREALGGKR